MEEANISLRKARHDYKNSLLALNGYLLTADVAGASKYLEELVADSNRLQEAANSMTLELANLQIKELKYLIIDKLQQAQDQGIKTKVEINKPIATLPVKYRKHHPLRWHFFGTTRLKPASHRQMADQRSADQILGQ